MHGFSSVRLIRGFFLVQLDGESCGRDVVEALNDGAGLHCGGHLREHHGRDAEGFREGLGRSSVRHTRRAVELPAQTADDIVPLLTDDIVQRLLRMRSTEVVPAVHLILKAGAGDIAHTHRRRLAVVLCQRAEDDHWCGVGFGKGDRRPCGGIGLGMHQFTKLQLGADLTQTFAEHQVTHILSGVVCLRGAGLLLLQEDFGAGVAQIALTDGERITTVLSQPLGKEQGLPVGRAKGQRAPGMRDTRPGLRDLEGRSVHRARAGRNRDPAHGFAGKRCCVSLLRLQLQAEASGGDITHTGVQRLGIHHRLSLGQHDGGCTKGDAERGCLLDFSHA